MSFTKIAEGQNIRYHISMGNDSLLSLDRSRFRAAIMLTVTVDALQILAFPLFADTG
jgi:hypothetical protein